MSYEWSLKVISGLEIGFILRCWDKMSRLILILETFDVQLLGCMVSPRQWVRCCWEILGEVGCPKGWLWRGATFSSMKFDTTGIPWAAYWNIISKLHSYHELKYLSLTKHVDSGAVKMAQLTVVDIHPPFICIHILRILIGSDSCSCTNPNEVAIYRDLVQHCD